MDKIKNFAFLGWDDYCYPPYVFHMTITLYMTTHASTCDYCAIIITFPLALFTNGPALNFDLTCFHTQNVHTTPL